MHLQARRAAGIFILFYSFLLLATGLCRAQSARHAAAEVQSIEIWPNWFPAPSPESTAGEKRQRVVIRNVQGIFHRTGLTLPARCAQMRIWMNDEQPPEPCELKPLPDEPIAPVQIERLLKSFAAPTMPTATMENLGITPQWLQKHADDFAQHAGVLGDVNTPRQQEFYRRSFTDQKLIAKVIPGVVNASWTDDSAWVRVVVHFKDGSLWTTESDHLGPFMLPWKRGLSGGALSRSYDANISRAIAGLLPEGTINRGRLLGDRLEEILRMHFEPLVRAEWQRIGSEAVAGPALELLKTRYSIRRTEVSQHHGLADGAKWDGSEPRQTNLRVDVFLPSFPKNLAVTAVFPIKDGTPEGVESFLTTDGQYETLVLENPWLMQSLRAHPNEGAWLHFVHDTSLSDKALRIYTADMHALGRDDLAAEVQAHQSEVALLTYFESQLILFPDHHAIIWRWGHWRELFSWPATSLKGERCTDYPTNGVECVTAQIRPDGSLNR